MSKDYGFHCETCNVSSRVWGPAEELIEVIDNWTIIKTIERTRWLNINIPHDFGEGFNFMLDHEDHTLKVVDEYGDIYP